MIKLLQILLPLKGAVAGFIPGWAQVRAFLWAIAISALLAGGAIAGAWGARLGEPARIAKAAKPLCDAAGAKAKVEALEQAVAEAELARTFRETQVETLAKVVAKLEQEQRDAREKGPGRDDIAVPGDSPWLQQPRGPVRKR